MATYDNTQVNTACAAVAGPYGPFTRVTDMAVQPVPNDMVKIQVTDANGKTLYMTYAELTTAALRNKRIAEVYGYEYVLHALINQVASVNTALQAFKEADASGYTVTEYEQAVELLRGIDVISGYL
jgi:hypothetical protein